MRGRSSWQGVAAPTSSKTGCWRNRLIHGYFDINTTIVWKTATVEVPELVPLLRALAGTTT
ncbi:MAG TPA: HepT-like ribonuclease domain-containing protein [Thermoanaerobaculia bacterium]|nr:HepT-like ribonuclease domain-containing protein [Thermoanaerobaculia bacterium]